MAPHLLTLPREIRDNIYQYLYQGGVHITREPNAPLGNTRPPQVSRAPVLSVMLTCKRLYEECREHPDIRNVAASLGWNIPLGDPPSLVECETVRNLARQIQHYDIVVGHYSYNANTYDWSKISRLVDKLRLCIQPCAQLMCVIRSLKVGQNTHWRNSSIHSANSEIFIP